MSKRKGLFLGAGASYDFGMPLVWQLTKEIRNWLTPEKLDQINVGWKQQGGGKRPETIDFTKRLLLSKELHYEQIIGALEVEANRTRGDNDLYQDLWGMVAWLNELIYILLQERQCKNSKYISGTLDLYYRFSDFVSTDYPFWIFTTNHDLNVEMLAIHYKIPYKTGFCNNDLNFPLRNSSGIPEGRIKFNTYETKDFNKKPMNFYSKLNDRGINLLKLHGALDIFLFNDNKQYIKLDLDHCNDHFQILNLLKDLNERLTNASNVKTTNEITFEDDQGEMQFLRRSILSGMHKFKTKVGQNMPEEILPIFRQNLNFVSDLVVVGYGFADVHINQILKEWLAFTPERRMLIVNPGIKTISDEFKIYINQLELRQCSFLEFLVDETNKSLTRKEKITYLIRNIVRKVAKK